MSDNKQSFPLAELAAIFAQMDRQHITMLETGEYEALAKAMLGKVNAPKPTAPLLDFAFYESRYKLVKALQYDGTQEMAEAIEAACRGPWCEFDEAGQFCGLHAFTENGRLFNKSECVGEGDYLVDDDSGAFYLVEKSDFEERYKLADE